MGGRGLAHLLQTLLPFGREQHRLLVRCQLKEESTQELRGEGLGFNPRERSWTHNIYSFLSRGLGLTPATHYHLVSSATVYQSAKPAASEGGVEGADRRMDVINPVSS